MSKLIGWCKSVNNSLQQPSLRLLGLASYPVELLPKLRETIRKEGILLHLIQLVRTGELKFFSQVQRKDIQKGDLIASGSGGIVFDCKWKDKDVVIKECSAEGVLFTSKPEIRVEVALMSMLNHPNIMVCLGANLSTSTPFFLMPKG